MVRNSSLLHSYGSSTATTFWPIIPVFQALLGAHALKNCHLAVRVI